MPLHASEYRRRTPQPAIGITNMSNDQKHSSFGDPSGYYDHHALLSLERPIVVSGIVPSESRQLAYRLASLYGVRFTDLKRTIEHHEGTSWAELEERHSALELRRHERQRLLGLLRDEPFGVVSVHDLALSMRENARLIKKTTLFVGLDYEVADSFRRFRDLYPGEAPSWVAEASTPGLIESLHRQWSRRFRVADIVVSMDGLDWEGATTVLAKRLASERGFPDVV